MAHLSSGADYRRRPHNVNCRELKEYSKSRYSSHSNKIKNLPVLTLSLQNLLICTSISRQDLLSATMRHQLLKKSVLIIKGLRFCFMRTKGLLMMISLIVLSACASSPQIDPVLAGNEWVREVQNYRATLPIDHPDQGELVLAISDEMREIVTTQFALKGKHEATKDLAYWLLDKQGRNMSYDVNASLTPIQAFEQRRGNCLSFTLLLAALTHELGIELEFNAVDIPNTWGLDSELGMIYYRHVNGVLDAFGRRQIFDLAMDLYDPGYPQHFISKDQALALLQNNKAMALLKNGELGREHLDQSESQTNTWGENADNENTMPQVIHAMKLAISLSPSNPDLWVNLGVVMKRAGQFQEAETAFLYSLALDKNSAPAASNLEYFYQHQGNTKQALTFKKRAERARLRNPYYHYQLALEKYQKEHFGKALKSTNRAIHLHREDPRFYELKSLISQHQNNYSAAYKNLEKAYALASGEKQRGKYASKAARLNEDAIERFKARGGLLREQKSLRDRRPKPQLEIIVY